METPRQGTQNDKYNTSIHSQAELRDSLRYTVSVISERALVTFSCVRGLYTKSTLLAIESHIGKVGLVAARFPEGCPRWISIYLTSLSSV